MKAKHPKRTKRFLVTVEIPEGVSTTEIVDMIREAVGIWPRSGDPDNPIFDLDPDKVRIKPLK